jgi:hypothetical protein
LKLSLHTTISAFGGIGLLINSRRRRITVKGFHGIGIQKNGIPVIMEIPELAVFYPMKGIQPPVIQLHTGIQKFDGSDGFTVGIITGFRELGNPAFLLQFQSGLKLE